MSLSTMIMTYYSLFLSIMIYRIMFWGNSSLSQKSFKIQKTAIRIIMRRKELDTCRNIFKKLKILPLKTKYIFSLLLFVVNN